MSPTQTISHKLSPPIWTLISTLVAALALEAARAKYARGKLAAFYQLLFFDDRKILWLVLALVVVALPLASLVRRISIEKLLAWVDRSIRTISLATFVVAGLAALLAYHRHPLSMDEFSIFYQSQVFAAGKLDGHVPPILLDRLVAPEFIIEFFGIDRPRGLVTSVYWPGTSLLMTPFTLLGVPWLCNPFLSAVTVFCLHRATRQITDSPRIASWTTLLVLASPVFLVSAASFYAMPAHMLASILFAWSLFHANSLSEAGNSKDKQFALVAGLVGGFALVLHNPIPHVAFCIPWLLWIAAKRRDWLVPLVVGYLICALPLGLGWFLHLKTLDAQMPQLANSVLARLPKIFVLPSTELLKVRLFAVLKIIAWAAPGMLVLAALSWRWARTQLWTRLLTTSLATLFFAYFFISYPQGYGWGYRFIHPAWFVLPLLAAITLNRFFEPKESPTSTKALAFNGQFFVAALALSFCILLPARLWQVDSFIRRDLAQILSAPSNQKSVLFINTRTGNYTGDLVQNDPFLRNSNWKLISRGPDADKKLAQRFLQNPTIAQQGKWGELIVEGH